MERLYGWLFTYNTYNSTWYAYNRDDVRAYWNRDNSNKNTIYSNTDINDLIKDVINGEFR